MIKYKAGYKYQLADEYRIKTAIRPPEPIHAAYVSLYKNGTLRIKAGYAWDGPSPWFVPDWRFWMRASLEHDAFFQLFRNGELSPTEWFDTVNRRFQWTAVQDGCPGLLAWLARQFITIGGISAAGSQPRDLHEAP